MNEMLSGDRSLSVLKCYVRNYCESTATNMATMRNFEAIPNKFDYRDIKRSNNLKKKYESIVVIINGYVLL
jgi:hypothetical protein